MAMVRGGALPSHPSSTVPPPPSSPDASKASGDIDASAAFNRCRAEVVALVADRTPIKVVQQKIDGSALDEDTKAVLRLWALRAR